MRLSFSYPVSKLVILATIGVVVDTLIGCAVAFAPVHPPRSMARVAMPSQATSSTYSNTALQAGLFDRFLRVSKSNVNSVLQRFEDPEKIIVQALEDMQADLVRVRQTYAEVTGTQRRLMTRKKHLESQAFEWYERAQLALQKSNEGLAREALARRETLLNQAKSLQDQIDSQTENIDALYSGMQALEKKITEAVGKRNQMVARARTAKTTQKVNDMLSGVTGKSSMDAFNKMEEKVLALEAAAEVSTEMATNMLLAPLPSSLSEKKDSSSDVELQFRMLEASDNVDRELQKLKANMLPSTSSVEISSSNMSP